MKENIIYSKEKDNIYIYIYWITLSLRSESNDLLDAVL